MSTMDDQLADPEEPDWVEPAEPPAPDQPEDPFEPGGAEPTDEPAPLPADGGGPFAPDGVILDEGLIIPPIDVPREGEDA